jgi:aryl-alcohol dehydrogenase-like predicted oxidoreductase
VGFGCWAIGGHGYGEVDDRTSIGAIRRALELGVNLFDTADVYGFGRSERVLAEALGDRLGEVVIATKFGVSWNDAGRTWRDSSPARAVAALDASLVRLGVERIPLYQVHWPDGRTPLAETLGELDRQRQAGKIEYIGVSNFSCAEIRRTAGTGVITSAQYRFNILDRAHQADIESCSRELGLGVLIYGVLARGLFTGKFEVSREFAAGDTRAGDPSFSGDALDRMLAIGRKLREIAEARGITPSQVAIRWALRRGDIATAIVGAKTPQQVSENAGGAETALSDSDFQQLDDLGY